MRSSRCQLHYNRPMMYSEELLAEVPRQEFRILACVCQSVYIVIVNWIAVPVLPNIYQTIMIHVHSWFHDSNQF